MSTPPPSPKAQPAPQSTPRVTGLSCPSCGGALAVDGGERVLTCPYCSAQLLALGEVGTRRLAVEPKTLGTQALETVRRWWGQGFRKHPALAKAAEASEAVLCFVPFYRAESDAVGFAFGVEERTRRVGSGKNARTETYEVDVEKRVEQHYEKNFAAVHTAELGIQRADLAGDTLVPFDLDKASRQGMVFPPTSSEIEARARAVEEFEAAADPAKGLKRTHFRHLALLNTRFSVVYYPFWMVRYRFHNRSYQAVIDAESGELAYGKAPGNDLFRALVFTGASAAACFLATTGVQWTFSGDVDGCGPLIFCLLAAGGLFFWGWRAFRYGGVVEEGTSRKEDTVSSSMAQLSKIVPPQSLLGKVMGGRR